MGVVASIGCIAGKLHREVGGYALKILSPAKGAWGGVGAGHPPSHPALSFDLLAQCTHT